MTSIVRPTYQNGFYSPTRGGVPAYPQLWRGCVGAWCPSLGPNGSILRDQSLARNHGTLTNMDAATDWVQLGGGYALDFDGSNDSVTFGDSAGTKFTNSFAISLWMWPATLATVQRYLISKVNAAQSDNDWSVIFEYVNDTIEFYAGGYTGTNPRTGSGISISAATEWYHIVYTYNGTQWSGWRNGTQIFDTSVTFTLGSGGVKLFLSCFKSSASGFFSGRMDDIRLYNRGLPSAEIAQLYRLGRGGAYAREHDSIGKAGVAPVTRSDNLLLLGVS